MKICIDCKKKKSAEDFIKKSNRKDGLSSYCKECNRVRAKQYYRNNPEPQKKRSATRRKTTARRVREYIFNFCKDNPCIDCGEDNVFCLDFDHVSGNKRCNVSTMPAKGFSLKSVKEEMAKCEMRCANCHRKKTGVERGWYQDLLSRE